MATDVTAKDFNPSGSEVVDQLKAAANAYAETVNRLLPASRRRQIALDNIEAASMFAVKAVFYTDENERTDA